MANIPAGFYASEIYLAHALNLPDMPIWEWREHGIMHWDEELHKPHGIKYLGQTID
jgi:hypothetical protein